MLLMVLAMADAPEDKKKLERLFLLYEKMMYRIAYNILHHHQDAEDALMTAWEKIASNLKKISEIDCPQTKSFIVIIVERTAIDLYRKNQRKRDTESLVDIYEESPVFLTRDKSFEDAELYEVFRQLPKQYGEVLTYHYMNSLSMKEIASILNISEEAVKKRIQRGRSIVAKELGINE